MTLNTYACMLSINVYPLYIINRCISSNYTVMHLYYWFIMHEVHTICMTTTLKYKKAQCHWSMYSKWMLWIYACYRPMRLTVHTIIYWCMLRMLSIGNASQHWYQVMMYQYRNIDKWCMFICILPCHWSQALHATLYCIHYIWNASTNTVCFIMSLRFVSYVELLCQLDCLLQIYDLELHTLNACMQLIYDIYSYQSLHI